MPLEKDQPTHAHRRVLQLMAVNPDIPAVDRLRLSPACITQTIGYKDSNYVGEVCRELASHNLLEQVTKEGGYYAITYQGRAYLKGDLELDVDAT